MAIQKITSGILDTTSVFSAPTISSPIVSGNLSLDSTGTSGVRLPAANTLAFYTAGTEDVRIDSSGNVGIGITSPSNYGKLAVNGTIAAGTDQTDQLSLLGGGGTARVEATGGNASVNLSLSAKGGGAIYFWRGGYGGTNTMLIDGSGDIFAGGSTIAGSTGTIYSKTTAKVFVQWVGSNGTINQSKNVSSVTRNSTGDYTVNFSFTFSTNYAVLLSGNRNNGVTDAFSMSYYNQTGSSIRVNTAVPAIRLEDSYTSDLVIFA